MRKRENHDNEDQWQSQIFSFSNNLVRQKSLNCVEIGSHCSTKVGKPSKGGSERSESMKTRKETYLDQLAATWGWVYYRNVSSNQEQPSHFKYRFILLIIGVILESNKESLGKKRQHKNTAAILGCSSMKDLPSPFSWLLRWPTAAAQLRGPGRRQASGGASAEHFLYSLSWGLSEPQVVSLHLMAFGGFLFCEWVRPLLEPLWTLNIHNHLHDGAPQMNPRTW